MRACEGCRRRKIKCDAATTNTWPCSACTRLKLQCIPPTFNQERDFAGGSTFEVDGTGYDSSSPTDADAIHHGDILQEHMGGPPQAHTRHPHIPYNSNISIYPPTSYLPRPEEQHQVYHNVSPLPVDMHSATYQHNQPMFPTPPAQPVQVTGAGSYCEHQSQHSDGNQSTAEELSEALGELKIDETGFGRSPRRCYVIVF